VEKETRRSFLTKSAKVLLGLTFVTGIWPYLRSLIANVLYEPPKRFKVGSPENFSQGMTFLDSRRIYIFREGNAFYSISGICTHLGCTVKYSPFSQAKDLTIRDISYSSKGEFHCPCHGSKFYDEGTNFAGPAPKPLQWFQLELSPEDGQLVVNFSKQVDRDFRLVV